MAEELGQEQRLHQGRAVDLDQRAVATGARLVEQVAPSRASVLIQGETGTGKELIAEMIHRASPRAKAPLVRLNCAALSESLLESELFGHEKGAFTGAERRRAGRFEQAQGGTLFLDEIGEIPAATQVKLLRVLQERAFERVGGNETIAADVRVIAATNRDLAEEVRSGRYRADFYHRLSVYPLLVPALRDRGRDVLLLSGYFLEQNRSRMGLNSLRLNADAQASLLAYSWPGNVRELEHLIGRSALKALGNCKERPKILSLSASDLDLPHGNIESPEQAAAEGQAPAPLITGDLREATENYQRQLIAASLERHSHNWASAARELGLDRANLGRMAKRLGMK